MPVRILHGDCRVRMQELEASSVHCCVTSPPYWGLRDYGTGPLDWPAIAYAPLPGMPEVEVPAMSCSLGLEPTLEAFIGHLVLVFREVRRVLRDDATCWVNMGDSYAGSRRGGFTSQSESLNGRQPDHSREARYSHQAFTQEHKAASADALQSMTASRRRDDEPIPRSDVRIPGLKPKDLVGQPWRLAFALQADGWWLRMDNIWAKRNPMPESCKDRTTRAHEYLFLLAKSERYFYDADAIKEPVSSDTHARYASARGKKFGMSNWEGRSRYEEAGADSLSPHRKPVAGWARGAGDHSAIGHAQPDSDRQTKLLEQGAYGDGKSERMGRGAGWRDRQATNGVGWGYADADPKPRTRKLAAADSGTKNNDSFDAAMAVMPDARNKRSVWDVVTEGFPEAHFATFPPALIEPCIKAGCPEGGTVLDPFGGSGTTGLVADRLGRNAVLCELNPDYVGIAERRLARDRGHVARQIAMEA